MKLSVKDNISEPVYYQIYRQIKDYIKSRKIEPGEQLPTERELNQLIGVSRITIRKAMKLLTSEGLCYMEKGKGVFVLDDKIPLEIETIKGTKSLFDSLGMNMRTEVIFKKIINCDGQLSKKLEVPKKTKILYLKRARIINNQSLVVENAYLSLERIPGLDKYNFSGSLYKILREKYNLFPDHSEGFFDYRVVDEEYAKLLNVPLNFSVLQKQSTVYTKENTPIEFVNSFYRSDRFNFNFHGVFR